MCLVSAPIQDFPQLASCNHIPDVCHDCFFEWLDQKMATHDTNSIACPSSDCEALIIHQDVQKYASPEVFARFDELSMRSLLSTDPEFLYCPAVGCNSGQIHSSGVEGPIFRCAACGYRICTAHTPMIPFHENESCTQYNERIEIEKLECGTKKERALVRKKQDEASIALLKRETRECPGCGSYIEKIHGCDHMTCEFRAQICLLLG